MNITRTIFKVELGVGRINSFTWPKGAVPLDVAFQGSQLVMWYVWPRDNADVLEVRRFYTAHTGAVTVMGEFDRHIGTAQMSDGGRGHYVVHVFEAKPL